jgi:hypothetical protein
MYAAHASTGLHELAYSAPSTVGTMTPLRLRSALSMEASAASVLLFEIESMLLA